MGGWLTGCICCRFVAESLTGKKLVEEENLSKIQNRLGKDLGGLFAAGGPGSGLGTSVGKSL